MSFPYWRLLFLASNKQHLMFEEKTRVSDITQFFRKELEGLYPRPEIEQFIALTFAHILDFSRVDLILNTEEPIKVEKTRSLMNVVEKLKQFEPIQYILGQVLFYGIPLKVNRDVLIPRPETEELVRWILDENLGTDVHVMDVCTGSGCIALALKNQLKDATVFGVDKSVEALNIATQNATSNKIGVDFFHFDVLKQASFGFMKFDIMVSNPPYVRHLEKFQMDKNVLDFEPHMALFVDNEDPLLFYRIIVELADGHLNKSGQLFFEINEAYGGDVMQLLRDHNYTNCELRKDLNGRDRMVRGIKS